MSKIIKMIAITLVISLLGSTAKVTADSVEIVNPLDLTISGQVQYFSIKYGADASIVNKVIECESRGNHDSIGDGGRSVGIAQFQKPTFLNLEKKMGEDLNFNSQFDQIKLLTWSIANGYGNNWTAYRAIKNGGKYSFYSNQLKKHFTVYCKL